MEAVQVVGGSLQIKAPGGSIPSACVWVNVDKGWPGSWVLWLECKPREPARGSGLSTGLWCVILSSPGPTLDNERLDLYNLHVPPETASQPWLQIRIIPEVPLCYFHSIVLFPLRRSWDVLVQCQQQLSKTNASGYACVCECVHGCAIPFLTTA